MNKQQEKEYKQYVEQCEQEQETAISKEDWITEIEKAKEQENQDYLNYQKKVSENNEKAKTENAKQELVTGIAEDAKTELILNKEDWIKKGKPTGESKKEKFMRLAERRLPQALKAIKHMENLAMPQYEGSATAKAFILAEIEKAVLALKTSYEGKQKTKSVLLVIPE